MNNIILKIKILKKISKMGLINDEKYLKKIYKLKTGQKLNLENPKTFNEKIQWLKLHDRKKIYTTMVDKYLVKDYVSKIIGKEYVIPVLGVYDNFNDIDFNKLPNKFVIKCNHDSGSVIICRDKKHFNIKKVKKKINKKLKNNFYDCFKEWPYKNVENKIIIEEYMEDSNNKIMKDYKFFCFDGKVELLYVSEGLENRNTASMSFFDKNFNLVDCKRKDYKSLNYKPQKPKNFEKMKEFASILSKGMTHIRVDFYEINGKMYFGELTFFTCSGYIPFEDEKWNYKLGELIKLPMDEK